MKDFTYTCAQTIEEAVSALADRDTMALAGGTDLIPEMRAGRRTPSRLVDLKRIAQLTAVAPLPDGGVSIGAAASASAVADNPRIKAEYPSVAQSARLIGSFQVQNRASLGGNICNAAPSADGVPALITHGARVLIAGPAGRRELAIDDFFTGPGRTVLTPGEILVAILLPPAGARSAASYRRFTPRREMDIAVAGVASRIRLDDTGIIADARVGLASVGPTPLRSPAAEQVLLSERPSPALLVEAGRHAARDARPISDTRGSAAYRSTLIAVLTARTLSDCCRRLGVEIQAP